MSNGMSISLILIEIWSVVMEQNCAIPFQKEISHSEIIINFVHSKECRLTLLTLSMPTNSKATSSKDLFQPRTHTSWKSSAAAAPTPTQCLAMLRQSSPATTARIYSQSPPVANVNYLTELPSKFEIEDLSDRIHNVIVCSNHSSHSLQLYQILFIMESKIYSHEKLVAFRRHMHENPELGFNEFNTRESIKKFLTEIGVDPQSFKELAKTALVVDLKGKSAPQGDNRCVAFRADMDALSMNEQNQHLPYRSKCFAAHMCGHDGHVTCLLAFVMRFIDNQDTIPSNKTARLLFQPSEQGPESGAKLMVAQGCMEGVDEVYGFHNWPTAPAGQLWVMQGPVMSSIVILKIKVIGTMGHGSEPDKVKDSIRGAVRIYQEINNYIDGIRKENPNFICTLTVFKAGSRCNVFGESAEMEGTIRSYDIPFSLKVVEKLREIVASVEKDGFKYEFNASPPGQLVNNTSKEAEHVLRVAETIYGKDKVGKGQLPVRASEDFGHFTLARPGAFFFLSSAKKGVDNPPMLHSNNFDFNEELIENAGKFWLALAKDRLHVV